MTEKKETVYRIPITVLPSQCDETLHLSVPAALAVCQDIATLHAGEMGVDGGTFYKKSNAYWVVSRIRLKMLRRPAMLDEITAETWPSAPAGVRCDRSYLISMGGEHLIEGRSEWTAIDADTRKLVRLEKTCYPKNLLYREGRALDEDYHRLRDDLQPEDRVMERVVRATDIDFAHHMNNVVYPRMMFDTFPAGYWETHEPRSIEMRFMNECHENETLTIFRRREEDGFRFAVRGEGGETAFLSLLETEDRK